MSVRAKIEKITQIDASRRETARPLLTITFCALCKEIKKIILNSMLHGTMPHASQRIASPVSEVAGN